MKKKYIKASFPRKMKKRSGGALRASNFRYFERNEDVSEKTGPAAYPSN
jgi:hypothetical protein